MLNILKCQAIYNGNIENISHTASVKNGSVVGVGVIDGDYTGGNVFEAVTPVTASLGTIEYVLVAQGEYDYETKTVVENFTNVTGTAFMGLHLSLGDRFELTKTDFTGTSVVGKYLIPANGVLTLAVADDLTDGTRLAFVIESITATTGYAKSPAVQMRVVSC